MYMERTSQTVGVSQISHAHRFLPHGSLYASAQHISYHDYVRSSFILVICQKGITYRHFSRHLVPQHSHFPNQIAQLNSNWVTFNAVRRGKIRHFHRKSRRYYLRKDTRHAHSYRLSAFLRWNTTTESHIRYVKLCSYRRPEWPGPKPRKMHMCIVNVVNKSFLIRNEGAEGLFKITRGHLWS